MTQDVASEIRAMARMFCNNVHATANRLNMEVIEGSRPNQRILKFGGWNIVSYCPGAETDELFIWLHVWDSDDDADIMVHAINDIFVVLYGRDNNWPRKPEIRIIPNPQSHDNFSYLFLGVDGVWYHAPKRRWIEIEPQMKLSPWDRNRYRVSIPRDEARWDDLSLLL